MNAVPATWHLHVMHFAMPMGFIVQSDAVERDLLTEISRIVCIEKFLIRYMKILALPY